jgi:epoxyqueuosine reductase|tara:strand:- start:881 stop:1933 length:1053 start_codon:yes stop_codon:yes gene_type:complete
MTEIDIKLIAADIKKWGVELGFQQVSFTDIDLSKYEHHLKDWIDRNYHGAMSYMAENHDKRCHPEQLVPGTIRVVCVRMDYALDSKDSLESMENTGKAYVSRYARGRDYHKLIRKRLQKLARRIQDVVGPFGYRAFVDSAPVLERALAEKSGMGWIGKNTMLINKQAGSWFFLGELFTDLPLPVDEQVSDHCGSCSACLDICPTNAFVKPNLLDATRCISYLTIELRTSIPVEFRKPMGNRIYGCDDCQIVCPWNKFSEPTQEKDFTPRHKLDDAQLVDLFAWSEREFLKRTEGSAIRRIGYDCWLRNIAVALGNAPSSKEIVGALQSRLNNVPDMVNEHIEWALLQHKF